MSVSVSKLWPLENTNWRIFRITQRVDNLKLVNILTIESSAFEILFLFNRVDCFESMPDAATTLTTEYFQILINRKVTKEN